MKQSPLKTSSFTSQMKLVNYLLHALKICCLVFFVLMSTKSTAQTFPPASSCTSGDLLLVGAELPPNAGEDACGTCTAGTTITRTLFLSINNKTGSTRTSFAFWGTLEIINADGTLFSSTPISDCRGPIIKNSINRKDFGTLSYPCGKSLRLTNLYLAWTSASPGETCPVLTGSPSTINPKCGILPFIPVVAGLDGTVDVTSATCTAGGSFAVSPIGGKAPYSVTVEGVTKSAAAGATVTFTGLNAGSHSILITDATTPTACSKTLSRTVGSSSAPTANAGDDFTKTCISNAGGKQIGEATAAGFTYSWSPTTGLSASNISDPTANPSSTTTYTVTKTNSTTGCSHTDQVTVTVNTTVPSVTGIGGAFTKTCTSNPSGATIGETPVAGFTYAWLPVTGLSDAAIGNPTANPSTTTTYTVTKTNTANGCTAQASVEVTVNNTAPTFTVCVVQPTLCANSGSVTINASGGTGFEYSINGGANYFSNGGVFSNLGSNSVTGIKVRNSDGCISDETLCNALTVCPLPLNRTSNTNTTTSSDVPAARSMPQVNIELESSVLGVKAYPNPFNNRVKFMVTAPQAGYGTLELMNMQGQKLKTIYSGQFVKGGQVFEMEVPALRSATLIYVFRMGDKQITGKLVQLNQ